jgi:protein SCO1/2
LAVASVLAIIMLLVLERRLAGPKPLPVYGKVADFTLTNQQGAPFSLADLRGHVWLADLIFTRCPGPCLKMTRQVKELQESLPASSQARLVTLTTDPTFDTPPILRAYADRFGADTNRWVFLTGTKAQIAQVAVNSLKLTVLEKEPADRQSPNDLFVHSTIFVLVDKQAQLRGAFETTGDDVDPRKVKARLLDAIQRLEREP